MIHLNGTFKKQQEPKVFVIHENEVWLEPLISAFEKHNIPYEEWYAHEGLIDIDSTPPEGVYYNRMSASSHTRDHRYAVELTGPILAWLEANGRRVINDRRALQLEVRKFEQYLALNRYHIKTPKTYANVGKESILKSAAKFNGKPFILKPNRGGKGAGVQLFYSIEALQQNLENVTLEDISLDGVALVQEYVKPKDTSITRMEFIGGQFYYAVRVDTSEGFELCPADACQVNDDFCPTTDNPKFQVLDNYENPEIPKYEAFLRDNGIEIGAIEYVENEAGEKYIYDVNINTNYNAEAESRIPHGPRGMEHIALFLNEELQEIKTNNPRVISPSII